jgi:sugar phosphate isomerase/epimerase
MKLACSSADLAASLEAGTLTQLEWLDWCAAELAVDGVVFDMRHFPRSDADYLAQLKKLCADLGLTVAAVADDALLGDDRAPALSAAIATALELGAPLAIVRAPLSSDDPAAWNRCVAAAKLAVRAAKRSNVTLALRNAPGTLCATVADCKRLAKDVDSAWLRFAPDVASLDATEPPAPLLRRAAIAVHALGPRDGYPAIVRAIAELRAFLVIEPAAGDPQTALRSAVPALRLAAAELTVERSATRA